MEIQARQSVPPVGQLNLNPAPPPPVADKRPTADTAALNRDATPETPLPVPPVATQQGLVGQLMIKEPEEAAKEAPDAPVSQAERVLKPYGVAMLPARTPEEMVAQAKGEG